MKSWKMLGWNMKMKENKERSQTKIASTFVSVDREERFTRWMAGPM